MNASRPSEHPPVRGVNVITFRLDHGLQVQNLFCYHIGYTVVVIIAIRRINFAVFEKSQYQVYIKNNG